ncbi:hypothetical protein [Acetonema longum]|uniref:Uncharacterized protein n=1 Tax=Acetonema longum DSM 6540 TaxID=1009370 RepID=F7NN15_9FIRM|nr:hypothetical protein [Acetonema longum]EGO62593.1 hypothetical protein ALO_17491 [Acetonema longum DSM 6540]
MKRKRAIDRVRPAELYPFLAEHAGVRGIEIAAIYQMEDADCVFVEIEGAGCRWKGKANAEIRLSSNGKPDSLLEYIITSMK